MKRKARNRMKYRLVYEKMKLSFRSFNMFYKRWNALFISDIGNKSIPCHHALAEKRQRRITLGNNVRYYRTRVILLFGQLGSFIEHFLSSSSYIHSSSIAGKALCDLKMKERYRSWDRSEESSKSNYHQSDPSTATSDNSDKPRNIEQYVILQVRHIK